ncbi:MAG: ribonuclease HII [Slackia sp.]
MRTLAEIKQALHEADREAYEAMARALAADERKGVKQALASTLRRLDAQDAERARLEGMYAFQREFCGSGLVAGLDEVGRGPVAGPLTVAAVVLPDNPRSKDSTTRSRYPREARTHRERGQKDRPCMGYRARRADVHRRTRHVCLAAHGVFPRGLGRRGAGVALGCVLLDGNPLGIDPRERNVVKGDASALPSRLRPSSRRSSADALMCEYAEQFPGYGFESNKGYASAEHISAILELGLSPFTARRFAVPGRKRAFSSREACFEIDERLRANAGDSMHPLWP